MDRAFCPLFLRSQREPLPRIGVRRAVMQVGAHVDDVRLPSAPRVGAVSAASASALPPRDGKKESRGVWRGTVGLRPSDADGIGTFPVPPRVGLCGTFGTAARSFSQTRGWRTPRARNSRT